MNVLITGASKGIGCELTKQFAQEANANIIALARDYEQLKTLQDFCKHTYNKQIHIYSIDLSQLGFELQLNEILEEHHHLDVVINNDLNACYEKIYSIIESEKIGRKYNFDIKEIENTVSELIK